MSTIQQLRGLSVRQPWASMIASGQKTIEVRTWPTKYRGDILIIAAKYPAPQGLPHGQAVAIARLIDCRLMTKGDTKAAQCNLYNGAWAWVLENIRQIKSFPMKGRLGLFVIPDHLRICYPANPANQ